MTDIFQAEFNKTEEVNESPQRIMAIQEAARRRISEYLHSHVQSKLLALQYYLSRCQELIQVDPEEAAKLLERIRADLQHVQDNEIRKASHELYPSVIRLGLVPALRSLRDRMNGMVPIELVVSSRSRPIEWCKSTSSC